MLTITKSCPNVKTMIGPESFNPDPGSGIISELEKILAPTFQKLAPQFEELDASSGGLALLERGDEVDRNKLDLDDLRTEEITADSDMPDIAREAERYLLQRDRVNTMLMILGRTDNLDEATRAYRLLMRRSEAEASTIAESYRSDPASLHLTDKEYAELGEKYFK
jgi:hypothetical protein